MALIISPPDGRKELIEVLQLQRARDVNDIPILVDAHFPEARWRKIPAAKLDMPRLDPFAKRDSASSRQMKIDVRHIPDRRIIVPPMHTDHVLLSNPGD